MHRIVLLTTRILDEGRSSHAEATLETAAELLRTAQNVRDGTRSLRCEFPLLWKAYIRTLADGRIRREDYKVRHRNASARVHSMVATLEELNRFHGAKTARTQGKSLIRWKRLRLDYLLRLEAYPDISMLMAYFNDVRNKRPVNPEHPLSFIGTCSPEDIISVLVFRLLNSARPA